MSDAPEHLQLTQDLELGIRQIVAVVSFSPIRSDSRVLRQIMALQSAHEIHVIGYGPAPPGVANYLQIPQSHGLLDKLIGALFLLCGRFQAFWQRWYHVPRITSYFARHRIAVAVLNDVSTWPLTRLLPPGSAILDAHEYSPEELADSLIWRLFLRSFKRWCSAFASLGARHFCVEAHLCQLWRSYSGSDFKLLPNTSAFVPPPVARQPMGAELRVLHHGVAHPSRRLELMIEAVGLAGPRFAGTFLLAGVAQDYVRRLQPLAASAGCRILPPIPQADLIAYGSNYDVAILSIFPSNVNYQFCLPNKLFQFIQSRLPIVCGPTPAIAAIVHEYGIGVVADDFTACALARALQSLTPARLQQMRANLDRAALELCWERDQQILLAAIQSVASSEP